MWIIGLSEPHCDASCALVRDGQLLFAVGEERFSRNKRHKGLPYRAIDWMLSEAGLGIGDIDRIALVKFPARKDVGLYAHALRKHYRAGQPRAGWRELLLDRLIWQVGNVAYCYQASYRLNLEIDRWIARHGIDRSRVRRVDHHAAHAYSAYFCSGFDNALVVTMDGQGVGVTATVSEARGGRLKRRHTVHLPNSVGQFYTLITLAGGFTMNRHEGKITGLAAAGRFRPEIQQFVDSLIEFREGTIISHAIYGNYFNVKSLLRRFSLEDVCFAFQRRLEEVVSGYIGYHLALRPDLENVAVGGGVFANVRLNQKLAAIPGIRKFYVYPNMGDGGSCIGAAYMVEPPAQGELRSLYLGPEFRRADVARELADAGLAYREPPDLAAAVAELLAEGKAVARFSGPMEFGPRALGNRSILMSASDSGATHMLNSRLRRDDFMPFAPVTMAELADQCYLFGDSVSRSLEAMSISVDCTDWMKSSCPAAVHIDGTARPQIVHQGSEYHQILRRYYELTGLPALINTSFNLHEEPIVCSPRDAIKTYRSSGLDALAIEGFLVKRP